MILKCRETSDVQWIAKKMHYIENIFTLDVVEILQCAQVLKSKFHRRILKILITILINDS